MWDDRKLCEPVVHALDVLGEVGCYVGDLLLEQRESGIQCFFDVERQRRNRRRAGWRGAVARKESRVAKAIVLAALVAGRRRSSFLGGKPSSVDGIIRMSQRCADAHHFYPQFVNSYIGDVENK